MVGRAPRAAHVAGWFQKWRIHRTLRPEEFGGRVHNHKIGAFSYPLHPDVLDSDAVAETFNRQGTYLCSTAYPEGAPTHTSYPSGHSVGAGSTITMLKALFAETFIQAPVMPSADGLSLVPYEGPPLTVRGELNKLAWNVGWFRCGGGIHWRSDVVARQHARRADLDRHHEGHEGGIQRTVRRLQAVQARRHAGPDLAYDGTNCC